MSDKNKIEENVTINGINHEGEIYYKEKDIEDWLASLKGHFTTTGFDNVVAQEICNYIVDCIIEMLQE